MIVQDNYYGPALLHMLEFMGDYPVHTVVLCPDCETIRRREAERGKKGYTGFDVEPLYAAFMEETPRVGLWVNNAMQSPEETAEYILQYAGCE